MQRPASSPVQQRSRGGSGEQSQDNNKRNRWAAAGQAVLNPSLQKEQTFPNSMGRSHFPRQVLPFMSAKHSFARQKCAQAWSCLCVALVQVVQVYAPHSVLSCRHSKKATIGCY